MMRRWLVGVLVAAATAGGARAVLAHGEVMEVGSSANGSGALTLGLPDLGLRQNTRVRVQLHGDPGSCWESTFDAPATQSDAQKFADAADKVVEPYHVFFSAPLPPSATRPPAYTADIKEYFVARASGGISGFAIGAGSNEIMREIIARRRIGK